MGSNSKAGGGVSVARRPFLVFVLCLSVVLTLMFFRGWLPGRVVFSNDGPLGAQVSECQAYGPAVFGIWQDLNWLGANVGLRAPNFTALLGIVLGPYGFSKFYATFALFLVGICAYYCFRQFGLVWQAALIGGLVSAMNSGFFATACWGVASQPICFAMCFLALGLVSGNGPAKWPRIALAGMCVGIGVMEAADIGALFSVFVALYVAYQALISEEALPRRLGNGVLKLAVVAGFAGFIAASAVSTLVGTQIKGISGTEQTPEAKAARWDYATQWSSPKLETINVFIPGIFGYRMDTPSQLAEPLQKLYQGGAYWGRGGRDPAWDRYFESGMQGPAPRGFIRYGGGGGYMGVGVVLIVIFAIVESFRKERFIFNSTQRKFIWLWGALIVVCMMLAWGRFAPFYRFFYALPYASTIRNPAKFGHIVNWSICMLCAYGVHGLVRRYFEGVAGSVANKLGQFEKKWMLGLVGLIAVTLIGWVVYANSHVRLETYLQTVQFDAEMARQIAAFSIRQVGWFVLFLVLAVGWFGLTMSGQFAAKRAKNGIVILGVMLMMDLGRANIPWVITPNWHEKYLQAGDNPVIQFLREKTREGRVTSLDKFLPQQYGLLGQVYGIEWTQHLFQYYNIQTTDIVQMPRVPVEVESFERAMMGDGTPATIYRVLRRWQLMNVRYFLGAAGMADSLNKQLDPQGRFRQIMAFEFYQEHPNGPILTRTNATGPYALMEFTGTVPRAKLYSNWQVSTNDEATLAKLGAADFDPLQTVLVAGGVQPSANTNLNAGTVVYKSYAPKHIVLSAKAETPVVLLLNDKYDSGWNVSVDGKPAELLRCNYVMRGVKLDPGEHTVEFRFEPPAGSLKITLAAIALGILMAGYVVVSSRRKPAQS